MDGRERGGLESGLPSLDSGLLQTATYSVARWRRRLAAGFSPDQIALIDRECSQLAQLAAERGSLPIAARVQAIQRALQRSPAETEVAIAALESLLRCEPAQSPIAGSGAPPRPSTPSPSSPPIAAPSMRPPDAPDAAPSMRPPDAPSAGPSGSVDEPPLMLSRIEPARAAPAKNDASRLDPLRVRMEPARSEPPPPAASARPPPPLSQAPSGADPTLASEQRGAAGRADRRPERSVRSEAPKPSEPLVRSPSQPVPAMLRPILGLNAFRDARSGAGTPAGDPGRESSPRRGSNPPPPQRPERQGVLGLRGALAPEERRGGRASAPDERHQRLAKTGREPRRHSGSEAPPAREDSPKWLLALFGALGLLAAVTVTVVWLASRHHSASAAPTPGAASASNGSSTSPAGAHSAGPADSAVPEAERLLARVGAQGKESPELRSLLEMQGRMVHDCKQDPVNCGRWTSAARDAFLAQGTAAPLAAEPTTPLAAWLRRLKIPADLPVRDDVALRSVFDLRTKNIAGRQRFQATLFDCGAYDDIFESTFVKYGAPTWLTAVVYQESACNPRATSPVGAKGLWQFMPESARAYGLRVVDGEVDERLSPVKSTDAAVHFLTDLQRKLGRWDLVLAAYNMGPFAVLERLAQAGDKAGFWELAHAGMLPEETAGYVPAIEAYALALANLRTLQFSRDERRLEATAEIAVRPGMRLSLLARAAATTTVHIRELNPEFLRDVIPEGETAARVPDPEAHRAEVFLQSWSPEDSRDTCVPEDFDWGAKPFENSRYAKTCGTAPAQ